jgi:hypothetical protein
MKVKMKGRSEMLNKIVVKDTEMVFIGPIITGILDDGQSPETQ